MNNGFFYSTHGNKSSSRLIGAAVIVYAMVMGFMVLYWGKENSESVFELAAASGSMFTVIGGSAMVFIFQQKRHNEIKQPDTK